MRDIDRFVRLKEVVKRVGLSRSTIYRMVAMQEIPAPLKLGRATVWRESELLAWMEARAEADSRRSSPRLFPVAIDTDDAAKPAAAGDRGSGGSVVPTPPAPPLELDIDEERVETRPYGWPEMMRRRTAAAYLDLSDAAFLREVDRARLPSPTTLGGRPSWSRSRIDRALASILATRRE